MKPQVSEAAGKLLLSYDISHRLYCAQIYPISSPNGSSIIVYGHELGISILWRGGKSFKIPEKTSEKPAPPKPKTNGTHSEDLIDLDSDPEELPSASPDEPEENVEFEIEEREIDPEQPFYNILQIVEIPLGAKALALSVPPTAEERSRSSTLPTSPILSKNIIIAAVCADCTTRIITLPLAPPPPKIQGKLGARSSQTKIYTITGAATHQDIATAIAITLTAGSKSQDGAGARQNGSTTRSSRSGNRGSSVRSGSTTRDGWDLLMATYSPEATGKLLIYRIPVLDEKRNDETVFNISTEHTFPIQRHLMHSKVTTLAFNPSPYPSARHSHLLVSTETGTVKLYSCIFSKSDRLPRGRRASDDDSAKETDGQWLIPLYPGFSVSPSGLPERKPVIAAEWVLGGKAVLALLADGEWGIWDIEGAGPGATQSLVRGQTNIQGVTGGALTAFAISGWITPDTASSMKSQSVGSSKPNLAPMTPHTRKIREQTLFQPMSSTSSQPTSLSSPFTHGHISVIPFNASRDRDTHSSLPQPDESIMIHYGAQNIVIPSLLSHWRTRVKKAGTFESSSRFRPNPLIGIALLGEQQMDLSQFPASTKSSSYIPTFPLTSAPHPDVLVAGERRLHILAAPLKAAPKQTELSLALTKPVSSSRQDDQLLLGKGELDVEGMDRILDGMDRTNDSGDPRPSSSGKRRVGFA